MFDRYVQHKREHLNATELEGIIEKIGNVDFVSVFDAKHNVLERFPENLTELRSLHDLYLTENKITKIPSLCHCFTGLRVLRLEHNQIEDMTEITELSSLVMCRLGHNRIKEVPERISKLTCLEVLGLEHNNIQHLPRAIEKLKVECIFLRENEELPKLFQRDKIHLDETRAHIEMICGYYDQCHTAAVDAIICLKCIHKFQKIPFLSLIPKEVMEMIYAMTFESRRERIWNSKCTLDLDKMESNMTETEQNNFLSNYVAGFPVKQKIEIPAFPRNPRDIPRRASMDEIDVKPYLFPSQERETKKIETKHKRSQSSEQGANLSFEEACKLVTMISGKNKDEARILLEMHMAENENDIEKSISKIMENE